MINLLLGEISLDTSEIRFNWDFQIQDTNSADFLFIPDLVRALKTKEMKPFMYDGDKYLLIDSDEKLIQILTDCELEIFEEAVFYEIGCNRLTRGEMFGFYALNRSEQIKLVLPEPEKYLSNPEIMNLFKILSLENK